MKSISTDIVNDCNNINDDYHHPIHLLDIYSGIEGLKILINKKYK